jgi:hypothetical protein
MARAAAATAAKSHAASRYSLTVYGGVVRWHTRVFAVELLDRLMVALAREPMHVDLARARRAGKAATAAGGRGRAGGRASDFGAGSDDEEDDGGVRAAMAALGGGPSPAKPSSSHGSASAPEQTDWLVLRLNDLIRMAFNASTAAIEPLRIAGFQALQTIVSVRLGWARAVQAGSPPRSRWYTD